MFPVTFHGLRRAATLGRLARAARRLCPAGLGPAGLGPTALALACALSGALAPSAAHGQTTEAVDWDALPALAAAAWDRAPGRAALARSNAGARAAEQVPGRWTAFEAELEPGFAPTEAGRDPLEHSLAAAFVLDLGPRADREQAAWRAAARSSTHESRALQQSWHRRADEAWLAWAQRRCIADALVEDADELRAWIDEAEANAALGWTTRDVSHAFASELARLDLERIDLEREADLLAVEVRALLGEPVELATGSFCDEDVSSDDAAVYHRWAASLDEHPAPRALEAASDARRAQASAAVAWPGELRAGVRAAANADFTPWFAALLAVRIPLARPGADTAAALEAEGDALRTESDWARSQLASRARAEERAFAAGVQRRTELDALVAAAEARLDAVREGWAARSVARADVLWALYDTHETRRRSHQHRLDLVARRLLAERELRRLDRPSPSPDGP